MANTKPSTFFFLLITIIAAATTAASANPSAFITEKCGSTPFPDLCVSVLSTDEATSTVQQSPLRLFELASKLSLPNLDSSANAVTKAQQAHAKISSPSNNDSTTQVLRECAGFVGEAKKDTSNSVEELGKLLEKKDPNMDKIDAETTPVGVKYEARRAAWGVMARASETLRNMVQCVNDIVNLETTGTEPESEVGDVRKSVVVDQKVAANVVSLVINFLAV